MSDVRLSLHFEEDTSSFQNMSNMSSVISEKIEAKHPCLLFTPLLDSSNHEDVDKHPEFYDIGVMISLLLHIIMILI